MLNLHIVHLHTEYSLLDGACDVHKLWTGCGGAGPDLLAMPTTEIYTGCAHFFNAAKERHQPILGGSST